MAIFPYLSNAARAKEILQEIQDVGVPAKVTNKYIESLGYKSTNDRALITVLRSLGFIDASGAPTDIWRKYRNKSQGKAVMAAVLRATYKDLFATYPDAYRRDNEALRNFFSSHTTVGEGALKYMVATFKSLTELADFVSGDSELEADDKEIENGPGLEGATGLLGRKRGTVSGFTVNVNIQLQIPETEKSEVYDSFFAAMKKHLLT